MAVVKAEIRPLDHILERGQTDDTALVLKERAYSYAELREVVAQASAWLASVASPGDRIASWAAKGLWTTILPLAAARAKLIHVPINPLLKEEQVRHILRDCGASCLIATAARLKTLDRADLSHACTFFSEEEASGLRDAFPGRLAASNADTDDLAAILYTSGSTGKPKGVMLSHANLWLGADSVASYLSLQASDRTLAVLPFSFDYGQNQLLSTWYAGGCVVPLDYLFPRDVVKACAAHDITTLAAVPPLWTQLISVDWSPEATGSMRRLTNSGGALTRSLITKLRETFPSADIVPMYGLTEAFRSTYLDPALVEDYPTSMGKAIPHAEILVVDQTGALTKPGEPGELVHCGPLVAQGYWKDRARTAERFRPAPSFSRYGRTAVYSGDTVMRDENDLLFFVGRDDAMIKSSGNRISPQEIEDVAIASGVVRHAVAFGVPDEELGQTVSLAVEMIEDTDTSMSLLQKHLKHVLPTFMQPRIVHPLGEMPLNQNGKIDRSSVIEQYGVTGRGA